MERTLTRYIRALRSAGAGVSTTEAMDAARTVEVVGWEDRGVLKTALGTVLAKSVEEKAIHEQLFELYFSRDAAAAAASQGQPGEGGDPDSGRPGQGEAGADPQTGDAEGSDGGDEGGDPVEALSALARGENPGKMAMALERAGAAAGVDEIRFATQSGYYVRKMMEQMGVEALEARLMQALGRRDEQGQAEAEALMGDRSALQKQTRAFVEARFEIYGRSAQDAFMNEILAERSFGALGRSDTARMRALVERMAKRLAVRHARRRKVRDRGRLDVRRTLRANAGHDGVPFDIIWKIKRKDRPKIVAVCDVSGSVAQYVRFLLLFLHALKEKVTDLETFAFSAHLADVSRPLETLPFETAMRAIVDEVGSGGTDYGAAFLELDRDFGEVIDRRTTVLVLGDGRSNYSNPRLDVFKQIADQAKRLVWLCPEPAPNWGSGDSCLLEYRPFCTLLTQCSTVIDLERALDEILMAYD
jgi:uncharacterized protein with von Willebrand factor type A (vWA) domain